MTGSAIPTTRRRPIHPAWESISRRSPARAATLRVDVARKDPFRVSPSRQRIFVQGGGRPPATGSRPLTAGLRFDLGAISTTDRCSPRPPCNLSRAEPSPRRYAARCRLHETEWKMARTPPHFRPRAASCWSRRLVRTSPDCDLTFATTRPSRRIRRDISRLDQARARSQFGPALEQCNVTHPVWIRRGAGGSRRRSCRSDSGRRRRGGRRRGRDRCRRTRRPA